MTVIGSTTQVIGVTKPPLVVNGEQVSAGHNGAAYELSKLHRMAQVG
jgi:hypothetical protein